jgi:hypothetical protein
MTIDTRALKALIHEAIEDYRQQLESLKELLESEYDGCGILDSDLQYELPADKPYLRLTGSADYPKLAIIETDYTGRWNAYIADEDAIDKDISPKLERALERARASAITLSAMGDMILEVVQS